MSEKGKMRLLIGRGMKRHFGICVILGGFAVLFLLYRSSVLTEAGTGSGTVIFFVVIEKRKKEEKKKSIFLSFVSFQELRDRVLNIMMTLYD